MAAQNPKQSKSKPATKPDSAGGWSFALRASLSVLLVWHLFVLFISPLSVSPTSPLVGGIAQSPFVRWYSDPLYLNHGYHFFGPDPPLGGQLVRYEVRGDDGRVVADGEFPNLQQQWPRLFYHRHMMLADQMTGMGVYGDPQRDRELMLRAYARHLVRKHDGVEARVENVWHRSLHPADVRGDLDPSREPSPADPNDPQFYESVMTVVERSTGAEQVEFDRPLLPPSATGSGYSEEIPIGVGR
ncbi:MAG: hypothetical protein AAGF31_00125 [Planctomycetota bacterium]